MILDLDVFIETERSFWDELQVMLKRQVKQPDRRLSMDEVRRFQYLYQRASADLVKINTFAGDVEIKAYLESLVARSYSQLHEQGDRHTRLSPLVWLWVTFPQTFRRHWRAFALSFGTFLVGSGFGAGMLASDYEIKSDLIPGQFGHLSGKPSERVSMEENQKFDYFEERQTFSATLMANNIKVSYMAMVMGFSYGVFTVIMMFYNGVLIGAIAFDYVADGQGVFLLAWLLPHGSIELPAIFIGGQAGLVLGRAMFGWGTNLRLRQRLRLIRADLITLIVGASLMMVWAGLIESFLSQYHGAALYPGKIIFGAIELAALILFLSLAGRKRAKGNL
ncbi:MAG: stage II sporulation protein M [Verrucomicrobiales bacterium]|nr:stage II sporulation protein M [Verrucomicrobiales bacterium]